MWDNQKVKEIVEKIDYSDFEDKNLSKHEIIEARQQIWYKLFKLLNYNVTMDMFKGSIIRWKSIKAYASTVRGIYNGRITEDMQTNSVYQPGLIRYIEGLMASGEEPYPIPEDKIGQTNISIQTLLNSGLITSNDVRFIYGSVSPKSNEPDTSVSGTRGFRDNVTTNPLGERDRHYNLTLLDEFVNVNKKLNKETQKMEKGNLYQEFKKLFTFSV